MMRKRSPHHRYRLHLQSMYMLRLHASSHVIECSPCPQEQPCSPSIPCFPQEQPCSPSIPCFPQEQPCSPSIPCFPQEQPCSPSIPCFPQEQPCSPSIPCFPQEQPCFTVHSVFSTRATVFCRASAPLEVLHPLHKYNLYMYNRHHMSMHSRLHLLLHMYCRYIHAFHLSFHVFHPYHDDIHHASSMTCVSCVNESPWIASSHTSCQSSSSYGIF